MQKQQLVTEMSNVDWMEQQQALSEARAAGESKCIHIKPATVLRKVEALRMGAQPGGTKMRNDGLLQLVAIPYGLDTLTQWCQLWADGGVPDTVSEYFLQAVLRPLRKASGKPRNIALLEILVKVPSAALQETLRAGEGEGLSWEQYGGQAS